jgi:hypothetical protein
MLSPKVRMRPSKLRCQAGQQRSLDVLQKQHEQSEGDCLKDMTFLHQPYSQQRDSISSAPLLFLQSWYHCMKSLTSQSQPLSESRA